MAAVAHTDPSRIHLPRAAVVAALGAECVGGPLPEAFVGVGTDTRALSAGVLFFALRGERFDAHDFVAEALRAGAGAVVVDHVVDGVGGPQLVVPDTLQALGGLAAWYRRRQPMRVVAITGSNGKTTTKEMIAAICDVAYASKPQPAVLKTEGNLNNLIGLPLTVLRACGVEEVGVLEMGMNQPGEIARMTEIAAPDFAIVTNVGAAHLEKLGSLAGVAAAKGELYAGLPPHAVIAVNLQDPWVQRIAAPFGGRRVTYGEGGQVRAAHVVDLGVDGLGFELCIEGERAPVRLPLAGVHNVLNALGAAAMAHAMGVSLPHIVAGLARVAGAPMRMQVLRLAHVTVINDAYNANPSSMTAALQALQRLPGRPVAVLGGMWELGAESERAHRELGERAAALGVVELVAVGAGAAAIADGARGAGMPATAVRVCADAASAVPVVRDIVRAGDVVLVKGSRGERMEQIVRGLEDAGGAR